MGCYRAVLSLDPRDVAYIAGLIDGEGTIALSCDHRNENRRLALWRGKADPFALVFEVPVGATAVDLRYRSLSAPDTQPYRSPWTRQVLGLK